MNTPPINLGTKADWLNPFAIALVAYYLLMAVVGLLVPEDILTTNLGAREFSDFMATLVPQIDRITALNIKPDVNRFYFSVLWAASPVFVLTMFYAMWDGWKKQSASIWWTPFDKIIWPFFFGSLAVWAAWDVTSLVAPTIRLAKFIFGTSLGRAVMGQIFVIGPLFFGIGLMTCALGWLTGYIPRNIKERATMASAQNKTF